MIVEAEIKWKEDGATEFVNIAIGEEVREDTDDSICYYCEDRKEWSELWHENSPADFVVINSEIAPF